MSGTRVKMVCWKAVWKVLSLATLFSILCSFMPAEQEYHAVDNGPMNNRAHTITVARSGSNVTGIAIPHIVHQTWDDVHIPTEVRNWTQSWLKNHPDWQHWFWTETGSRHLIGQRHPNYLSLYDQYPYMINRADVRRYFIMYEYGGIYADLDVESLKSLDGLLRNYQCIIAQEPEEHQTLLYHNEAPNFAMPAFMACRPRHPFFKLLIDKLADYISLAWKLPWNENIIKSTGPMFVGKIVDLYAKLHNNTPEASIHLAPAAWFMPTFDAMNTNAFHQQCSNISALSSPPSARRAGVCSHLLHTNYTNVPGQEAFTNHHWLHAWGSHFRSAGNSPINMVIPKARIIHHVLPHVT